MGQSVFIGRRGCRSPRQRIVRRLMGISLLAGLLLILSGCQTASYYSQAIKGQWTILQNRQPIDELRQNPSTPSFLKERFGLVERLRRFAEDELHLPVDGHYRTYVQLDRPHAVWNVYASRPFAIEAKTWWYPIVGSMKYRGFFNRRDAEQYAQRLKKKGWEVHVEGVDAYSTLGWFQEPLLSSFIHYPETQFVATLFHELAHQELFIGGATDFNEAFATAVEREGTRRWLLRHGRRGEWVAYRQRLHEQDQVVGLLLAYREQLRGLYEKLPDGIDQRGRLPPAFAKEQSRLLKEVRSDYKALKADWGRASTAYDPWFEEGPLNNAQLSSLATYHRLLPAFSHRIRQLDGDLPTFYEQVRALGREPEGVRQQRLAKWQRQAPEGAFPEDELTQASDSW